MTFNCEYCGHEMTVDDRWAGKVGKCNFCNQSIVAPGLPIATITPPPPHSSPPSYAKLDVSHRAARGADLNKAVKWGFGITCGIILCIIAIPLILVFLLIAIPTVRESYVSAVGSAFEDPKVEVQQEISDVAASPNVQEATPLEIEVDAKAEAKKQEQKELADYIQSVVNAGYLAKVEISSSGIPTLYTGTEISTLTIRSRDEMFGFILAYYASEYGSTELVVKEFGTGKYIGNYLEHGGFVAK